MNLDIDVQLAEAERFRMTFAGIAAVLALFVSPVPLNGAERLPNIVLILADDLGWSGLGCYDSDLHQTPNIDRLARQGIRFTNAYAASPVCTPTRASIMTGKYPARLHMTIWHEASSNPPRNRKLIPPVTLGNLPHKEVTIAEVLRAAGYFTAHVGKWHLGDAAHYPENQGFDVNIGGTFWGAPPTFFYPYSGPFGGSREPRYVPDLHLGESGEYLTDRLTDEALEIIERNGDRPFFLHMAYHSVHTPIEAKEKIVASYRAKLRPGLHHSNPIFAGMVHSLDENVGRILEKLDELKLAESTIVIFTSDNGGFINSHRKMKSVTSNYPLRSGKGSLYEGGIRIPLIVRWPGVTPRDRLCHESVMTIDFYRTLLDAVGLDGDADHNTTVDGMSLIPLMKSPDADLGREDIFFHYPHYYPTTGPVSALRSGDWKLIEFHEDQHVELYNLNEDLGEEHDLTTTMPRKVDDLRQKLARWLKDVDAQMPSRNEHFP